jgi:hypothetical protein
MPSINVAVLADVFSCPEFCFKHSILKTECFHHHVYMCKRGKDPAQFGPLERDNLDFLDQDKCFLMVITE